MQASTDPSFPNGGQSDTKSSCVYLLNLPTCIDESALSQICSSFGEIQSCRVVPNDCTATISVGFVSFTTAGMAADAVRALHGAKTDTGLLEVQAGPAIASRQAPCDNLYVRNMPANWTEQELHDLFQSYGTVQECRILHRGDDVRGAGALVRMNCVANASLAILNLNGHVPVSGLKDFTSLPLLVRFADSPEEKARKQARKEQMAQQSRPMDFSMTGARLSGRSLDLPTTVQMERFAADRLRFASLPSAAFHNMESSAPLDPSSNLHMSPRLSGLKSIMDESAPKHDLEALLSSIAISSSSPSMDPVNPTPNNLSLGALNSLLYSKTSGSSATAAAPSLMVPTCTSLYVKNLPPEADRLWMYERFAPHGSILSVKVLQEENSSRCRGVGFVNFVEASGALKAINNVSGMKVADKHLHVSLQANRGCF